MGNENDVPASIDMVEESDFVHVIGKASTNGTDVTPATSASSSPALLPSEPPDDLDVSFECLDDSLSESSGKDQDGERSWVAPASKKSLRTHNPIRAIVDPIMANSVKCGKERGDGKDQISLALGDPTAYGNIPPCPAIVDAITKAIQSPGMAAGYVNACGSPEARAAIAKHHSGLMKNEKPSNDFVPREDLSKEEEGAPPAAFSPEDVIVASGASGALELALTALLDEDSVLLVPRPGFPLYQVIAESHGASVAHYDLLPDKSWECDLEHMERIILERERKNGYRKVVRGILVNNPSNPTGAVYGEEHLMDIVKLAEKYRVPIIADEIYGDMTFGSNVFHPMANVAAKLGYNVPIITASGLGKQYLVPGWRLGWIVFQDNRHGSIQQVKEGARRLAQVVLGASHLAQVAVPAVLAPSEDDAGDVAKWKAELYSTVERQAELLCGLLGECHGLNVIFPEGAMYAMVRIDTDAFDPQIVDDVSFMRLLLEEENVVVLPGRAFGLEGSSHVFRVVFCAPEDILRSAAGRISDFCLRHRRSE